MSRMIKAIRVEKGDILIRAAPAAFVNLKLFPPKYGRVAKLSAQVSER